MRILERRLVYGKIRLPIYDTQDTQISLPSASFPQFAIHAENGKHVPLLPIFSHVLRFSHF